ncbi:MAG: N-(5'-phosphoribosyl)anthranilate isomerase [Jhaorihella sp.]
MAALPAHLSPERRTARILASRAALSGGFVKRRIQDVARLFGRATFTRSVGHRGFRAVENSRRFVVFCNPLPILRLH